MIPNREQIDPVTRFAHEQDCPHTERTAAAAWRWRLRRRLGVVSGLAALLILTGSGLMQRHQKITGDLESRTATVYVDYRRALDAWHAATAAASGRANDER